MSRDCREGSVLAQQTVLGFSTHPPSPFGAASLPHCVTQQRGGQQSFAMNQHTQLQFNLGVRPHPTNLATYFDPSRPSPVVIEKPSFVPASLNGREFRTISAKKLALAVRLAKRDLRLGRFQSPSRSPSQPCPLCRDEQRVPPSAGHCSVHIQEPQSPDVSRAEMKKEVLRDTEEPLPHRTLSVLESEMASSLVEKEGNQRRRDDRSSQDVLRLRKELQRQVAYIKQLRELGCGLGHVTSTRRGNANKRSVRMVESGRVWMEEVRGDEEKLLQREEERSARNARTIYNLSHQLGRLQQDMQRLQLSESTASQKSGAIRRLATIYRAALRLLQNYQSLSHTPQPLPPELALLLQQLSLLSYHFGVGGAKSELDATLKQLQELVDQEKENELVTRQPVQEKVTVSQKSALQKRSKPRNTKKTNVFSHPQLVPRSVRGRGRAGQPPHFAQQTLSSQRRQQPKQTATATRSSPLKFSTPALVYSSTPFVVQTLEGQKERYKPVLQSAKKQKRESPPLSRNHPSPLLDTPVICNMAGEDNLGKIDTSGPTHSLPVDTGVSTNGQRGSISAPCLVTENRKIDLNPPIDDHREPAEGEGGGGGMDEQRQWMESVSATLAHHSQQLEQFKTATQRQLGQLQQKLSSQKKTRKKNEVMSPTRHGSEISSEDKEGSSLDGRKLEGLMERLRELEGEEEVIRERWRTITYEDPPLAKPPILHPSQQYPSCDNVSPPPCVPDDALERITNYRQRFQHHLQMTGHSTRGGFNPWNMAEKLADDLLSEVVDQVTEELGQVCDGYVDQLFSSEFVKPHSPTHS